MKRSIHTFLFVLYALSSISCVCAASRKPDAGCKRPSKQELEQLSDVEQAAYKLTERFLDAKDNKVSWACFATLLAYLANKDEKYKSLVKTFKELAKANNSIYIGVELEKHLDKMPTAARGLIKCYADAELLKTLEKRIELNKKHMSCNPNAILNADHDEL